MGRPHAFEIERAASPFFGARAYGPHQWIRAQQMVSMWIARRADDRPICPGMLDNMIAGGRRDVEPKENVIKEGEQV